MATTEAIAISDTAQISSPRPSMLLPCFRFLVATEQVGRKQEQGTNKE
ncbi:hypothetical protein [Vacuolonema iberomarrocanum]|nr:hypothetical protein [filamentous cyanobacterium LEGE 07170]